MEEGTNVQAAPSTKEKLKQILKLFRPSLLMLCIASSIRNAGTHFCLYLCSLLKTTVFLHLAGYVWAYNTQVYFDGLGQTPTQIGSWMSWIPIVGGSIGNYKF